MIRTILMSPMKKSSHSSVQLVCKLTEDQPRNSKNAPMSAHYPRILSILGYLGYPGMVADESKPIPSTQNT